MLRRAGAVGQRGVVGAEADGDGPARVVAAVAAEDDVGGAGVVGKVESLQPN